MIVTLFKMVLLAFFVGVIVGVLMFLESNLEKTNLTIKLVGVLLVVFILSVSIKTIGIRQLILPLIFFSIMSFISSIGLFTSMLTKRILEIINKRG